MTRPAAVQKAMDHADRYHKSDLIAYPYAGSLKVLAREVERLEAELREARAKTWETAAEEVYTPGYDLKNNFLERIRARFLGYAAGMRQEPKEPKS